MKRTAPTTVAAAVALALATGTALAAPAHSDTGTLSQQDLATAGTGSPYYRIPALTTTESGTVLAAYDARPTLGDLPSNIGIMLRRSTDDGRTWQSQQIVRKDPAPRGYGDPSLLVDRQSGRIFLFYAAGQNQGYFGSATGTDENDPNVLQADYSYSDDDGRTWKHRRITHEIKDPAWAGLFAASGQGIQIKRGPYAGRLVQQYSVRYKNGNWAASAYSDDHGETWHMGELVGPGTDENKSVELADGRLMLNVRSSPHRLVAYSSDGGATWSGLRADPNLIDPGDNGSVIRWNPNASPRSPEAHKLLFSNNESTTDRANTTVKMSCDDGRTWPIRRTVEAGPSAYSTLARLRDGSLGLLYERGTSHPYEKITFARFGDDWLNGVCAPLTVTPPESLPVGRTSGFTVMVTNQERNRLTGGELRLDLPDGWSAPAVKVPTVPSGGQISVTVPVTVPDTAIADAYPYTAHLTTNKGRSYAGGTATIKPGLSGQVPVDRKSITIASVDSEETAAENGRAANAIDGNPATKWHTAYSPSVAPMPHQLTLDLGTTQPVSGLRYLPRQDSAANGDVARFTVEISDDNESFRQVFAGTYSGSKNEKEVTFAAQQARYVRFTALSAVNGQQFAAAAEVTVLRAP
ncbi:exo-alpha-sialidase [Streptomyces sp. NPDC058439]|uniref:exo-alpha-sialidase n=1 Tax=Streptomyces sp. NPDC058439 TaxID=3346500 RepID=UPI00364F8D68